MECEKDCSLQATNDTEHIISDSFMLEGQLTDLYLHPQELRIVQKDKTRTMPFQFGLHFDIIEDVKGTPVGLEFSFGESKVTLIRDFWPRAKEWESHLLKHITRTNFHEFFKPLRKIGKGNFATVYLAEDIRANRKVAIKAFMKEPAFRNDGRVAIENEIKLMRRIKHPNLVSLHGVYETKNSLYLSMEYVEGHSLDFFLRKNRNPIKEQRHKLLKGLLSGLKELARLKIVHRDLKPENVIVSDDC
jgi:serine/threonine protein kinase